MISSVDRLWKLQIFSWRREWHCSFWLWKVYLFMEWDKNFEQDFPRWRWVMLSDRTLCDYRVHIMHHRASHLLMLSLSRLGCRVAKLCSSLNFTLTLLAVIEVMDHVFDIPGTQMSQSKISRGRGMTFAHHPRRWGLMTSEACWHFLHPAVNGDWWIRVEFTPMIQRLSMKTLELSSIKVLLRSVLQSLCLSYSTPSLACGLK